jgi:hypothetical protein
MLVIESLTQDTKASGAKVDIDAIGKVGKSEALPTIV